MKNLLFVLLFSILSFLNTWAGEEQQMMEGILIRVGEETFKLKGYNISHIANGKTISLANFARPTVSMLLEYRPYVKKHFSYNEKFSFFDIVEDVESEISTAFVAENKIWVGFSFYEGEGWEGYGGIGFYDLESNRIGVLRHPALMDCSVKSLMVKDKKIYILTIGNYELSSTVCNGLVIIDMTNLETKAFIPPGNSLLWDKDEGYGSAAEYYDRPISEIIKDRRFVPKSIKSWSKQKRSEILKVGLEHYMIEQAEREKAKRNRALSEAIILRDEIVKLTFNEKGNKVESKSVDGVSFWGNFKKLKQIIPGSPERFCTISGIYCASFGFRLIENNKIKIPLIYPPNVIPKGVNMWINAEKGERWQQETTKYFYTVVLEDFEVENATCTGIDISNLEPVFDSITFRVQIKRLAK